MTTASVIVMRNEWRYWWHARTPALLLSMLIILWLTAGIAAHHHWQEHARVVAEVAEESARDWQSQPDRHPHRVSHYGDFVAKPLHPLTMIEPGILDQSGHLVYLEAHRLNSANFNPATEATSLGRFPVITPAMVVQWWMPLFVIMMGYTSITREKIHGTLMFMRGNGTSGLDIAVGKTLALFIPFFCLILLQAMIAWFLSQGSEQQILRLSSILLGESAYLAGWCMLVVGISWVSRQLHSGLLALLLCWVCICIIFPRGLANIAQILHPSSARVIAEYQAETKLKQIGDSHNPDDPHFAEFKAGILNQYGVDSVEKLPVNYHGLLMQEGERLTTAVYREQQTRHDEQLSRQNQLLHEWCWLTPALALQYLHMASSGSDLAHHQAFIQQAEQRRYALIQYLNQIHTKLVPQDHDKDTRVSANLWKEAPREAIYLAPLSVSASALTVAVMVLFGWLLVTAYFLSRCVRKV
jgi:ABC-2 type transport system permease protein